MCLSTSQQVIRWASAWLTSRKLRPLHLMTSLSSWYDLLILWPVKCEWLSYRVRHGNTILRWLIILKQKNLKKEKLWLFSLCVFHLFKLPPCEKRHLLKFRDYKFSAPKWFNCNVRYCGGRKLQHLINKYYLRGVSVFFIILDWFVSFNFSIFALVSFNLIGKYSRCTVNGKYQWQLELLEVFENHLSTSIRIPPSSENLE